MTTPRTSFSRRLLVMCEGHEDQAFLKRLTAQRGLPPFHIQQGGGNSGFGRVLALARKNSRGFDQLHNVLILTDSDNNSDAAFVKVRDQLLGANFQVPEAPLQPGPGRPSITVMVVEGNLECYCRQAATSTDAQLAGTVTNFTALVTHENWPADKEGKLWLRASLAARNQRDPFVTLGSVFTEPRYYPLVPVDHPSFNALEALIRQLA